ncbi:MAG TPA: hypothetical protein VGO67_01855 [Verrucomicrobiae bacterium]
MSYVYPVTSDHPLCGAWVALCSDDSSDYPRTEYTISVADGQFCVTGVDPLDGEQFLIFDVGYDGESIRFVSLMPSTGVEVTIGCALWTGTRPNFDSPSLKENYG